MSVVLEQTWNIFFEDVELFITLALTVCANFHERRLNFCGPVDPDLHQWQQRRKDLAAKYFRFVYTRPEKPASQLSRQSQTQIFFKSSYFVITLFKNISE